MKSLWRCALLYFVFVRHLLLLHISFRVFSLALGQLCCVVINLSSHGVRLNIVRWHHRMEKFSALQASCKGNHRSPGFPLQRANFDVLFYVRLNKQLNKHLCCQWFDTPWRPCVVTVMRQYVLLKHVKAFYPTRSHVIVEIIIMYQCFLNSIVIDLNTFHPLSIYRCNIYVYIYIYIYIYTIYLQKPTFQLTHGMKSPMTNRAAYGPPSALDTTATACGKWEQIDVQSISTL